MIVNADLQNVLDSADDFTVVAEIYASDAHPPFDPADAEKRFAPIGDLTFAGEDYERRITRFGTVKRQLSKELDRCSIDVDNIDGQMAAYELSEGFEGKILVLRLISRSLSDTLAKSLVLFSGRCDRPDSGTKGTVALSASQIVGAIDNDVPRRKFTYDDLEGRLPEDKLFEGFRYVPQYGTLPNFKRTLNVRELFRDAKYGIRKDLEKFDQYSSFSDLDAKKSVPLVLGRAQIMGHHVCYADVGTFIHTVTAFCDGPVLDIINIRTDDQKFYFYDNSAVPGAGTPHINKYLKRYGYAGGTGPSGRVQDKYVLQTGDTSGYEIEGNGYYSKTAFIFGLIFGSENLQTDPAPNVIAVILGSLVTVPDPDTGSWTVADSWSDNPAAHAYFLLTSDDYGKLDASWIDEASFTEAYDFNDGIIYDGSFGDQIATPDSSTSFTDGSSQLGMFMASTGYVTSSWFKYLRGAAGVDNSVKRIAGNPTYTDNVSSYIDPDDPYPGGGGTSSTLRSYTLRRRYTSNVVAAEQVKVSDFMHDVIFGASRMYLTTTEEGKLALRHKKPVPHVFATAAVDSTSVAVDDLSAFSYLPCTVVIDPNTTESEIRTITNSSYSTATPTISVAGSSLSKTDFTGSGGGSPKTATVTVGTLSEPVVTVTLDGIAVDVAKTDDDDSKTLAGYIAHSIDSHPVLGRRFRTTWDPDSATFTISFVAGSLTLDEAPSMTHTAPVAKPTTAPTLAGATGVDGHLALGAYKVAYSYTNKRGETVVCDPATVTLSGSQTKIAVTGITKPADALTVRWYCSVQKGSSIMRLVKENDGSGFTITDTPKLSAKILQTVGTTGCELMQISAVFTDGPETRSKASRSNVIKGSFKWSLAKRSEAKNFVELKFRDATQDFRLTTLNLKDDAHIAKVRKTNKLTVNGAAIDNYNQAYRIAASALSENLDANFLYQWKADRTSLLLQEGDVVAITDGGLGVVNLPVRIESMEMSLEGSFPVVSYTGRKYSTLLYSDEVAERLIPVVIEQGVTTNFAP